MKISLDDAYREACLALGESIVQQRLLGNEIQTLSEPQKSQTDD